MVIGQFNIYIYNQLHQCHNHNLTHKSVMSVFEKSGYVGDCWNHVR